MDKNFNRQLTSKSSKSKKSAKSSKSAPKKESESAKKKEEEDAKSHKSGKSGKSAAVSEPGEYNPLAEPSLKEKGWFTKQNVQGFLHYYIQDKMKNDKLGLAVSLAYANFLQGLEKPMQVGEMRVMKEPRYTQFRELVRDPARYGDRVLAQIAEHCESLGIPRNSYQMIHEGFWDIYCKKPQSTDITAKKLEGWINLIKLTTNAPAAEGESTEQAKAVVRVRIPFKRPDPAEEGDEDAEKSKEEVKKEDAPLEEIEYID